MSTERQAEAWYYVVSAASTLVLTGFLVWKVYLDDIHKAAIRRQLRRLRAPLWELRSRRDGQTRLTFEVIQAQDALNDYDAGRVELAVALETKLAPRGRA